MQGGEELSIEELFSNLSTYKEQLQQVRELLVHDPGNPEYADMEKELSEDRHVAQRSNNLTANGFRGDLFSFKC